MLKIQNLRRHKLEPVDLTVETGHCVAVTGPSGSGKTLFLRAVADLDPNEGSVQLNGIDRDEILAPQWRQNATYVPADRAWWMDTVGPHFADIAAAKPYLESMGLGADAFDWPIDRLSTGERQRLGLARAMALSPDCLLLDEPTSGLDETNRTQVEALICNHLTKGGIALMVTHDLAQARRLATLSLRFQNARHQQVLL